MPDRLIALVIFAALIVIPAGITLSKGQWVEFFIGFLLPGIVWIIASCRLARPSSWWARRFYDQEKMQRALNRFGSGAS
jgi:peptidoglycan/LPS O-acetylase OafA/YrhL